MARIVATLPPHRVYPLLTVLEQEGALFSAVLPAAGLGPTLNTTPEPNLIYEGERVPYRDAKRRVWKALDALRSQPSRPICKPAGTTEVANTQHKSYCENNLCKY